jgi:Asp-tRNA(Asn)/Glu-tRNA(Gln) amidotransferase A subunit family amidase
VDEHSYVEFDGLGLAELVAAGEVRAEDLLRIAQARADRVGPSVNAICNRLDERAERQLNSGLHGPFVGVPFLIKDLQQDLAGTTTTGGCRALANTVAPDTSTVVQRWLAAGLVIFGKTNTPEFGRRASRSPNSLGRPEIRGTWTAHRGARQAVPRRPSPRASFRWSAPATAVAPSASPPRARAWWA